LEIKKNNVKVVFFQRKPRPNKNFSIEILFDQIRSNLPKEIECAVEISKYYSKGLLKRLYISFAAMFKQGDVNHVTGDVNFLAIFLKKRKTVLTILDLGLMGHPNPIARKILQYFWIQLPVTRAGYVTTISTATKNELLKFSNIQESKVQVLYIPVANSMEYKPKVFNTEKPVILQIGTKDNKNLVRLSQALKGIPCQLSIVGVLTEGQLISLQENVIDYTNVVNISNEELKQKYEEADLLAFVSTYEGFGMPIVEAQIVGRPVITSNLLSMPEVAGEGAHFIDPYNVEDIRTGILKIIEDDNYRNELIEIGRKNAIRFSVETISNQYAELYKSILKAN
jgi:glycosyltransferase involved in cell wall biosynthesis